MAYDVSTLTNYIDELSASGDIWMSSILGGDTAPTLAQFQTKFNVLELPRFEHDRDIFQDGDNCTFSASGDADYLQNTITLCNLKINTEFCVRDLEDKFTGVYLPGGQNYEGLPNEAMHIDRMLGQAKAQNELLTWRGDTAFGVGSLLLCDGYIKIVNDNIGSVATGAAISTGAITSANALGFVEGLVDAAIDDVDTAGMINQGGFVLYMGHDAFRAYDLNYRTTHGDYVRANEMGNLVVQGTQVRIIPVGGLNGQNAMYLTPNANFSTAMDLASDIEAPKIGMDQYMENVWVKLRWKQGFGLRDFSQVFVHV